jgi:YD repeat-containing protein
VDSVLDYEPASSRTSFSSADLFDELGNLTERQNNNAGLTEDFYYDDVYRLDHSSLNGTLNLQMGYDANGNITSRSDLAGGATWAYDATHKHAVTQVGSSTYTYDANGNGTSRNGLGITWTSYNHPLIVNKYRLGRIGSVCLQTQP